MVLYEINEKCIFERLLKNIIFLESFFVVNFLKFSLF